MAADDKDFYQTIEKEGRAEFRDRGSRFTGIAFPVTGKEDCKMKLQEIRKQIPGATHYCFAWRLGTDENNFRASDDGEPSGTAGRPILTQIDSRKLTNVMVVVVRFFGGTLLGTGGLINAYRSAAAMCLQMIPVVRKAVEEEFSLRFDYTVLDDCLRIIKQCEGRIISKEIQLFCSIRAAAPKARMEEMRYRLQQVRGLEWITPSSIT